MEHRWSGCRVGITGARGALGQALARRFHSAGAMVTGFTHGNPPVDSDGPVHHWVQWSCGAEAELEPRLADLDLLVLNHGINPHGDQSSAALDKALAVNALSSWRLLRLFEKLASGCGSEHPREVWVNTSEAEIQPALSPVYELSKRLIGQLISLRGTQLSTAAGAQLRIRKLVLGPFRSDLNPIGLMSAGFVADQILVQARLGLNLIIVTPNPFTYLLMPIHELGRRLYGAMLSPRGQ